MCVELSHRRILDFDKNFLTVHPVQDKPDNKKGEPAAYQRSIGPADNLIVMFSEMNDERMFDQRAQPAVGDNISGDRIGADNHQEIRPFLFSGYVDDAIKK